MTVAAIRINMMKIVFALANLPPGSNNPENVTMVGSRVAIAEIEMEWGKC